MPVIDLGSVVGTQGPQGAAGATGAQGIQGNPGPNQVTDQTSTNLNGVLFGNQSRVTVKPVDSDPTADSTNLVSSGGTDKAIKGRVPVYGMGKNLLDNWYFVGGGSQLGDGQFPINQRGQTSYSGNVYGIDRWQIAGNSIALAVYSDKIRVTYNGSSINSWWLRYYTEASISEKVTVSFLLKKSANFPLRLRVYQADGTNVSSDVPFVDDSTYVLVTRTVNSLGSIIGLVSDSGLANGYWVDIVAAKAELGTEQTLCHNEGTAEAPVWVLNEIPDYGEELRKCQRYFVPYAEGSLCGSAYGAQLLNFIVPVTCQMAKNPTVGTLKVMYNGGDITSNYNQVPSYVSRAGHIAVTVSSGSARSFGTAGAYGVILQNISAE